MGNLRDWLINKIGTIKRSGYNPETQGHLSGLQMALDKLDEIQPEVEQEKAWTGSQMVDDTINRSKELLLEAANALWAIAEEKEPDRPPKDINHDIYKFLLTIGYPGGDGR